MLSLASLPTPTRAQDAASLQRRLALLGAAFRTRAEDAVLCRAVAPLDTLLAALVAEEADQRKTSADVAAGFTSDEAPPSVLQDTILGRKETTKTTLGLKLSRGSYPDELSFDTQIGVTLTDGEFTESLSRARVTYDHYVWPWLEGYAFVNRLSNDYLSIDQRYESGIGAVVDLHPFNGWDLDEDGWTTDAGKQRLDSLFSRPRAAWDSLFMKPDSLLTPSDNPWSGCFRARKQAYGGTSPQEADREAAEIVRQLRRLRARALESARYRTSGLRVALLVGLMAEMEQAAIKIADGEGGTVSVNATGVRTYRWEIRPTFAVRPIRPLEVRVDWYYQRAFAGFRMSLDGRSRDSRSDLRFQAIAKGDMYGLGTLNATLEYRRLYDNAPPFVTETEATLPMDTTVPLVARKRYTSVSLKLGFSF